MFKVRGSGLSELLLPLVHAWGRDPVPAERMASRRLQMGLLLALHDMAQDGKQHHVKKQFKQAAKHVN